jgi:hypothetical protein
MNPAAWAVSGDGYAESMRNCEDTITSENEVSIVSSGPTAYGSIWRAGGDWAQAGEAAPNVKALQPRQAVHVVAAQLPGTLLPRQVGIATRTDAMKERGLRSS